MGERWIARGRAQLAHDLHDEHGVLLMVEGAGVHLLLDELHVKDLVDLLAQLDVIGQQEAEQALLGLAEYDERVLVLDGLLLEVVLERVPEGLVHRVVYLLLEAVRHVLELLQLEVLIDRDLMRQRHVLHGARRLHELIDGREARRRRAHVHGRAVGRWSRRTAHVASSSFTLFARTLVSLGHCVC